MGASWAWRADAAWRLGPRPVVLALLGRGPWMRAWLRWRLPGARPDPMGSADIRPLWEAHRWNGLDREADPAGFAQGWLAAHPPFGGPLWACGQEAALRALHLLLACALAGEAPPAEVLRALRRRVAANPTYAMAQDNNHGISEAAALWALALALDDAGAARRARARLSALIGRLVAEDGGFSQPSPAYQRLLLDTVSVACWLAARAGQALPEAALARMRAATRLLLHLAEPETGALPRIGHQDGSRVADLSGAGADSARGSLERAARIFCGASAGWTDDPGCARMGLACPEARMGRDAAWEGGAYWGRGAGGWRAILRRGPPRFRPNHADFLHLDLWDGALNLLRDGGTGAYNPAERWWRDHFPGTAAHNTACFDGRDQMPRIGPFLFARWPRSGPLPEGGWMRDRHGCRHERRVAVTPEAVAVRDTLSGPFREAVLRWRLPPGEWRLEEGALRGAAHRIAVGGAALRLVQGWESPAYGAVRPAPVLEAHRDRPGEVETRVERL